MSTTIVAPPSSRFSASGVTLDAHSLTEEQFFQFCVDNRDLRFEMTADGELIIMPPTGTETGRRNFTLTQRLANWTEADGTGIGFDSSTGFLLPNGAKRSPDASWILKTRYEALPMEERKRFAPICPDFVLELRSETDSLEMLQEKMREYMANGAQLGWLLDSSAKRAYVYRPGAAVEVLEQPATVSGEPVLRGFVLSLEEIW